METSFDKSEKDFTITSPLAMQEQIEYLRAENERKDHIIMNLTNKIPQLAAPKPKRSIFKRWKHEERGEAE